MAVALVLVAVLCGCGAPVSATEPAVNYGGLQPSTLALRKDWKLCAPEDKRDFVICLKVAGAVRSKPAPNPDAVLPSLCASALNDPNLQPKVDLHLFLPCFASSLSDLCFVGAIV